MCDDRHALWPSGRGEMAERVRAHDWAATPLGPAEAWPQSMRTAAELVLEQKFPSVLMWGPALVVCAYNDAYRPLLGSKPGALGRPFLEVWSEARHVIAPQLDKALAGEAAFYTDAPFTLLRHGHPEQAFFDYGFTPVRDESGAVAGVLNTGVETTGRLLAARELRESEERYRALFDAIDEGYLLAEVIFSEDGRPADIFYLDANPAAARMLGSDLTGRRLKEAGPGHEAFWRDTFGRVARTGEGERLEHHARPDRRWYDFYVFKVGGGDGRRVAAVFNDITARKRRESHLAFLADIAGDFSRLSSADEIMQTVGAKLGAHMEVATVNFLDVDEAREEALTVSHIWRKAEELPDLRGGKFRVRDFLTEEFERACRAGETWVVRDTQADPRTDAGAYANIIIGAFVGVPFHHAGEWKYFLSVTDTRPRDWREDEVELFQELVNRLFPRLERARAEEALRRAHEELEARVEERTRELRKTAAELLVEVRERAQAESRVRALLGQIVTVQEGERRRIARELHDTLGQQLAALRLSIDMIKSESEGRARLREHVARTQGIFDLLNSDVDFLAWELRPAVLDHLGLDAAARTFVREWAEHFGVSADYRGLGDDAPRLAPEVESNLYRILQEALQNVHKHAGADRVGVQLERRDGCAVLIVEDNGRGYDPEAEEAAGGDKGMGVVNMRERAALVGGEFEIESAPGVGTTIFVRVPHGAPAGE